MDVGSEWCLNSGERQCCFEPVGAVGGSSGNGEIIIILLLLLFLFYCTV
jgi:hypothetical protein